MKKHLISAMMALALLLTMMLPAAATSPSISNATLRQFRAGYVQDGKVYVYLQLEQNQLGIIQLQLKMNETVVQQQSCGYVREGDKPIHYLLLVDCSSTVRSYKEEITSFAYNVLKETLAGGGAAAMSIAGLGDSFRILTENCTDPETLQTTLNTLSYSDSNTDLYTGIQDALSYIQNKSHPAGELYQLILVTDGRQDKNGQLGMTQEQLDQLESSFSQRQDVVFHTYGVSEAWHNQELQQAELGRGCHLSLVETLPEAAAKTIADFTNALYQGVFELDDEMIPSSGECLKIQVLFDDQPGGTSVVSIPVLEMAVENESGSEGEMSSDTMDNEDEGGGTIGPEAEQDSPEGEQGETAVEESGTDTSATDQTRGNLAIWLIIPVAVIAALGGWLLRQRVDSVKHSKKVPEAPPAGAVCIRFEVERGRCLTRERSLYLVQDLIIGRSQECDLVFDEPDINDRNSRIIMQNGEIYLEDLNSTKGTAIGGMRIYAPNRLRSGDVITIGKTVQIRVEYDRS